MGTVRAGARYPPWTSDVQKVIIDWSEVFIYPKTLESALDGYFPLESIFPKWVGVSLRELLAVIEE